MSCTVCKNTRTVSTMTDGKFLAELCDECRPMVVVFFHVYGQLEKAVTEVTQAKRRDDMEVVTGHGRN